MAEATPSHEHICNQLDHLASDFEEIQHNEKRTLIVVLFTAVMMVVEIAAGYLTGSMALLADGYHMASHAGALGVAYLVYRLARSPRLQSQFTFGTGKLLPLGGYTSAIGLGLIALWMVVESIQRLFNPVSIQFQEAMIVAVLGLVVNLASAWILSAGHPGHSHHHSEGHDHSHVHDHNHRSAVMHVLSDALTSVLAIVALAVGYFYQASWLDPAMGVVGAGVILRWAYLLCKEAAWELLDGHSKQLSPSSVRKLIEEKGFSVLDLHLWKVGPGNFSCQLIVSTPVAHGPDYYRGLLAPQMKGVHFIVEERVRSGGAEC